MADSARRAPGSADPDAPPSAPIEETAGGAGARAAAGHAAPWHPPIRTNRAEHDEEDAERTRWPGRPPIYDEHGQFLLPPIRTDRRIPPLALTELLDPPSPEEVKAARIAAGHTQAQAAETVGFSRKATWSDYEGPKQMPSLHWTWYLLATGQHPTAVLSRARKRIDVNE